MEDRFFELGQAMFERQRQITIIEEHGVAQAGADNAFVARDDDVAAIGCHGVGCDDEVWRQLARAIAQAEALLVGADRGDNDFLWQLEEVIIETAHHHDGPFHKTRYFFQQALIGDYRQALSEGEMLGIGADDVLAAVDIEHYLGAFQRLNIIVEAADRDGGGRQEAVAKGGLARLDRARCEGHDHGLFGVAAEGCCYGAQGAHPVEAARAPAHGLGPGEVGQHSGENV